MNLRHALILCILPCLPALADEPVRPVRTEVITPIHSETFNRGGLARERKQGGNPRTVDGRLLFDGSMDGDRQVDPQVAVGNGYVLHGSNGGLVIYDKQGRFVQGVKQTAFNNGIDPKLFFDMENRVFGFDLWVYWDKEKVKPVNISISETADPRGAWNTYPVPAPNGVDGGAIGHSRKWIGYSFPGGPEQCFVMRMADAKSGKPATVYHFAGQLGHPVNNQDRNDDLYFFSLTEREVIIRRVTDGGDGTPVVASVVRKAHNLQYTDWPPASPQKGTDKRTASGDRNPKAIVLQNGCLWFSHTVNIDDRAAVQWHQVKLDGTMVQSGRLAHPVNSYIETTLGVNKRGDVCVGFQEAGPDMFISPRCAVHGARDAPGSTRGIISLGEGKGATEGGAWGDYSCTVVDGDNRLDFWTIQSSASAKGSGETVIARIPAPKR